MANAVPKTILRDKNSNEILINEWLGRMSRDL